MNINISPTIVLFVCLLGCGGGEPGLYFPTGESEMGKVAFAKMNCYSCHKVAGEDFPDPVADPPVDVVLDSRLAKQTRQRIAESIIAPSHRFVGESESIRMAVYGIEDVGMIEQIPRDVSVGSNSRMGDFSDVMTVRELIDIVEYLKSLDQKN